MHLDWLAAQSVPLFIPNATSSNQYHAGTTHNSSQEVSFKNKKGLGTCWFCGCEGSGGEDGMERVEGENRGKQTLRLPCAGAVEHNNQLGVLTTSMTSQGKSMTSWGMTQHYVMSTRHKTCASNSFPYPCCEV